MALKMPSKLTGSLSSGDLLNGGGATLGLSLVEGSGADGDDLDGVLGARLELEDGVTGVDRAGEGVLALESDDVGDLMCEHGARNGLRLFDSGIFRVAAKEAR